VSQTFEWPNLISAVFSIPTQDGLSGARFIRHIYHKQRLVSTSASTENNFVVDYQKSQVWALLMHEILPVLKKSFGQGLKARRSSGFGIIRTSVGEQGVFGQIKKNPDTNQTSVSLDRVLPGPRLRFSVTSETNPVAFESLSSRRQSSINTVGPIWTAGRNSAYNKMRCWVQFLSTPTADTPGTTLILHFDAKRYLIGNIAEGTQRAAIQRKAGLVKVSDIFLTGTIGWRTTGGILGMILTLADSKTSSKDDSRNSHEGIGTDGAEEKQWLNIHGGKNLTHLLATARRFVFRKGLPIHTQEFRVEDKPKLNWEPTWKDDLVKVWAMVIEPGSQAASPKKRRHNEFKNDGPIESLDVGTETSAEIEDREDQIRKGVVASMFDSKWRLDTLVTKKLSQVAMPATVFFRNHQGKIEKYEGPMIGEAMDVPDIDVLVRNPWPGALVETLPPTVPATSATCYIIKGYPQRGKFLPKIAIKLGVKPGPQFHDLTMGKSVITFNGTTVTPEQVMEEGKEGGGFAVIDLPNKTYVEALVSRREWASKEVMNGIGVVIWILGPGVVEDPRLQTFMKNHRELKHIVSSEDTCSNYLALESAAAAAIRLHLLDPERFQTPVYSNTCTSNQTMEPVAPYENARVGKTIQLEPRIELQDDKIVQYLDTPKVVNEASAEVQQLADKARMEIANEEYVTKLTERQKDIPCKDAEIITLGTGSALPSKYRNVSATLLRVPGFGSYLFDCGENTLGQLKRVLGEELPGVLRDLKVIWISHLHADHHLGTTSVIKAWDEETGRYDSTKNQNLIVASDEGMINWLKEYSDVEKYGHDRVEPITMGRSNRNFCHQFESEQTQLHGLTSIQACSVEHCAGALAVVFNFPNGFKVAYSGDCRPSSSFAKIGNGATLLIHEATFDDELKGDAQAKKHSTTSEALGVGKEMNARRILLTHFSQRYQKIPVMDNRDGQDQVALVAFDYMRVKLGDFAKVEAFKPALMKLYEDKEDK
jgi:ribonuclease Z